MTKTTIVALTGYANTGKDTVADLLVAHAGFHKMAFADALRGEVAIAFGIPLEHLTDRELKEVPRAYLALDNAPVAFVGALLLAAVLPDTRSPDYLAALSAPRSPRQIMQWWGTEYRRNRDPSYWTRALVSKVQYRIRTYDERRFVITDCRFANEAEAARGLGGRIWQMKRPGIDGSTTAEGTHCSATDGTEFAPDLVINNCHDVRHLQQLALGEVWAREAGLRGVRVEIDA